MKDIQCQMQRLHIAHYTQLRRFTVPCDQTYFLGFYAVTKTFKYSKHSRNNFCSLTGTATSCSGFMQRKQYSGNKTRALLGKKKKNCLQLPLKQNFYQHYMLKLPERVWQYHCHMWSWKKYEKYYEVHKLMIGDRFVMSWVSSFKGKITDQLPSC